MASQLLSRCEVTALSAWGGGVLESSLLCDHWSVPSPHFALEQMAWQPAIGQTAQQPATTGLCLQFGRRSEGTGGATVGGVGAEERRALDWEAADLDPLHDVPCSLSSVGGQCPVPPMWGAPPDRLPRGLCFSVAISLSPHVLSLCLSSYVCSMVLGAGTQGN